MTNKLKTLSPSQLEYFIKERVDEYLDEDCTCMVRNTDVPYIDTDADIGKTDVRTLTFEVTLSYKE
jgi:hypothetical protein